MIPVYHKPLPHLTVEQMREVDRLMIEVYHIELIQMMENAGRNLATLARERFLDNNPQGQQIAILAGTGGNGGGALVCARWLHNAGADVQVFLTASSDKLTPVPAHQLDILLRMGVSVANAVDIALAVEPHLIVDGIIGYSLSGSPHGNAATLIRWANTRKCPILSLDIPSGLDASTGIVLNPTIHATATMTLALPKEGLQADSAKEVVGELYLADISVPPELYSNSVIGMDVGAVFANSDLLKLR